MALTITQLFAPTVLTNAAATIFTLGAAPASNVLPNGRVRFTNTTGGAVAVTAYAIPSGGVAGAGNEFMAAVSIAPNTYLDVDLPFMKAGDFLQAFAGAGASITIFQISGSVFS